MDNIENLPTKDKVDIAGITNKLQESIPDTVLRPTITEIGKVVYVGDGICRISGLPSAKMEDIVTIQTTTKDVKAMVLGVKKDNIEAVVLGDYTSIAQGNIVMSGGASLQIQACEGVLGRVINPLGDPLDGKPAIRTNNWRPIEYPAPGVAKRKPVEDQLETGMLVVDTLIPLGRGQRELVIGDRKSGKTRLMTNLIINQKGRNVICVYVAIGAQKAKVRILEEMLRQAGALDYTAIVVGCSDDSPSINYLAPYAGTAIAEYFMYSGRDVIVIYDDLSRHAKAYRQMSLLLKRSPGRDAYPGDIFYLHSRLLERSSRILPQFGGGSITGFPMAETQNGDVSEYICTNLMSITDGHIYLDVNYLHEGILPAVNSSVSVSRIGGSVQIPTLRKMGEMASTQMARYLEVKSFETINTEISDDTARDIKIGKHLLEIFSQDSSINLTNDEKVILLHLVCGGKTHDLDIPALRRMKVELIEFYEHGDYKDFKEKCNTAKNMSEIEEDIMKIVADFAKTSQIPGIEFVINKQETAEKPLPIVPDPQGNIQSDETNKQEGDKKEEGK